MKKKKILPVLIVIGLILVLSCGLAASILIDHYSPSQENMDLSEYFGLSADSQTAVILNEEVTDNYGTLKDDHVYLSYDFIHENINSRFYWSLSDQTLFYVLDDSVITVTPDSDTYLEGTTSKDFGSVIFMISGEEAFLNLDFVQQYTSVDYAFYDTPNRVVITTTAHDVRSAAAAKETAVRYRGGIKSDILTTLSAGDPVFIRQEFENWTEVMTADGFMGYVLSSDLTSASDSTTVINHQIEDTHTHILLDEPICLAWHQVTNTTANSDIKRVLSTTKGLNVISPTWFYLNDNEGGISDIGSSSYVATCHDQGIQVWGLVSNLEDSSVNTATVLTDTGYRTNLIDQLISAAAYYDLDGINIDFESLNASDVGCSFIEFIRELAVRCHQNNLILSVDNYVPSSYTAFYDRAEQAAFADYVIIMAYDEHTTDSEDGSVASLSWVDEGISQTLEEVPAEQVILGNPFYTRIWTLTEKANENIQGTDQSRTDLYNISSQISGMDAAEKLVSDKNAQKTWDDECGQYYAEWTVGDTLYEVWLEDASSIQERLDLEEQYSLAGAAFWKLGFESSDVWDVISSILQ